MKSLIKVLSLFSGIVLLAISIFYFQFFIKPLDIKEDGYLFELKSGESLGHLALKLKADGVIAAAFPVKLYGRISGFENHLKAGEYLLQEGDNLIALFDSLEKGKTILRSITFVEGWSYKELFSALKNEQNLRWENSEQELQRLKEELTLVNDHLEGMFFADTYFYNKGQSAFELLKKSNRILHAVLQEEWQNREQDLPFDNAYEALILASIVEKETGLASERPLIAGVFINRLNKKMRLQTDPTVIYGMGDNYQGNISKRHLQEYTPYNTYRISGLPPSPIAIVGRESIHAVMHPKVSNYLFFVAKGDGSHYFSPTLEEHEKAVRQYQWKRTEHYRSAPVK